MSYKDRRQEGDTVLRQCQLAQLYILYVIDEICAKENIRYFLSGGTLLGSMRHNGFIPWDDDLDIGVPYSEYGRFLKAMRKHLPANLQLQTPKECPNTAIPFAKVRDTNSFYGEIRPDLPTSAPSGIYVDVFPYEEIPEIGPKLQLLLVKWIGSSWMRTIWFRNKACYGFWIGVPCLLLAGVLSIIHAALRLVLWGLRRIYPSDSVFYICESGMPYRFKKGDIYPLTKHVFEDGEFPVPNDADAVLTAQYGDWRKVPPESERPHHARIIDPFHSAQ